MHMHSLLPLQLLPVNEEQLAHSRAGGGGRPRCRQAAVAAARAQQGWLGEFVWELWGLG